ARRGPGRARPPLLPGELRLRRFPAARGRGPGRGAGRVQRLQRVLPGVGRAAPAALPQASEVIGTVYLVGAGPGAPDLLTVRAARLLGEADIVFHDALVPEGILSLVKGEKVAVGKRFGRHSTAQRFINKRLADAAHRYRVVMRLKGGDPMLFGRALEEIRFLIENRSPLKMGAGFLAALAA